MLCWKLTVGDSRLLGAGIAGILIWAIVAGVEKLNGPAPSIDSLQEFSGRLLSAEIVHDRSRVSAEILVERDKNKVIIFQQDMRLLADEIKNLRPGEKVLASIEKRQYADYSTGFPRFSMWQLSVGGKQIFTYGDLVGFRNDRLSSENTAGFVSGMFGLICFGVLGVRKFKSK